MLERSLSQHLLLLLRKRAVLCQLLRLVWQRTWTARTVQWNEANPLFVKLPVPYLKNLFPDNAEGRRICLCFLGRWQSKLCQKLSCDPYASPASPFILTSASPYLSVVFIVIILHCQDRPEHAERLDHLEVPSPAPLSVPSAPSAPSMPSVPVATLPAAVPMVSSMHVASSAPFTESAPAETGIRKKTRKAGSWRALKITVCHNSVWYSNFFRSFLGLVFLPLPPEALLPGHASRPQEAGSCESHLVVAGLPLPLGISFGSLSKAGVEATRPVIPVVEEFGPYPTDPTDPTQRSQRRLVAGARASTQDWREAASGGTGHVQRLPWLTWWLSDWSFDGHFIEIEIHSNALRGIKATSTSWASLVGTQRAEKIDFEHLIWLGHHIFFFSEPQSIQTVIRWQDRGKRPSTIRFVLSHLTFSQLSIV